MLEETCPSLRQLPFKIFFFTAARLLSVILVLASEITATCVDGDSEQLLNLFDNLQRRVFALQNAVASTFQTYTDMEISRHIQEIKYYILHKIYTLIRRPLSKQSGLCDVSFSCVFRRHQFSLQCSRSTFTHLSQDISRTVDLKNTLFLPTLAAATGGYSSQCRLHIAFENVNSFFLLA